VLRLVLTDEREPDSVNELGTVVGRHILAWLSECCCWLLMIRAHSFLWDVEFRAEPQNLPFAAEF